MDIPFLKSSEPIVLTSQSDNIEKDCDCACPNPSSLTHSNVLDTSHYYHYEKSTLLIDLHNGYFLVFSPYASTGPCVINSSARNRLSSFMETPQRLTDDIDLEFVKHDLISISSGRLLASQEISHNLVVWVHVTNACNLDCPYCYVQKSSSCMDETTGLKVIGEVFDVATINQFRGIKFKYSGGETLLNFKLVKLLHERVMVLASQYNIFVEEILLSNGIFIKPEIADWLFCNNIKLMISIDGIGKLHNQQRPSLSGENTFAEIEHNIDDILIPKDIHPNVSITITRKNAHGISNIINWVLDRDLPFTLNFYRRNSRNISNNEFVIEENEIINGMLDAYKVIEERLPTKSLLNGLIDRVYFVSHTKTCGVGSSYMVVGQNGKISQCQMHLHKPVIDEINPETFILSLAKGKIINTSVDQKQDCRDCLYRFVCTGGCPLETYQATGRWNVRSPHCQIYKTLIPEALKLEGLRILKENGCL